MPRLTVVNAARQEVGSLDLSDALFGDAGTPHVVWEVVKAHLAGRRRGSAATKTRGDVSGGGKKPWKQKGTGRARVGSSRNPLWRHGGVAFGPHPRDHAQAVSKMKRRVAVRRVVADMVKKERVTVLDGLTVAEPRTKAFKGLLAGLGLGERALVLVRRPDENLRRASSNLAGIKVVAPDAVNAYDLLRHRHLLATREALVALEEALSR